MNSIINAPAVGTGGIRTSSFESGTAPGQQSADNSFNPELDEIDAMEDVLDSLKDEIQGLRSAAHQRGKSTSTEISTHGSGSLEEEDSSHESATGSDQLDKKSALLQERSLAHVQDTTLQAELKGEGLLHNKTRLLASPTRPGYQSRSDDFPALGNPKKVSAVWAIQPQQAKSTADISPTWTVISEQATSPRSQQGNTTAEVKQQAPLMVEDTVIQDTSRTRPAMQQKSPVRTSIKPTRVPQPVKTPAKRQVMAADPPSPVDPNSPAQRLMREHYERDLLAAEEARKKAAELPRLPSPPKPHDFPAFGAPTMRSEVTGSMPVGESDLDQSPPSDSKSSWARIASGPRGTFSIKPAGSASKRATPSTDSWTGWPTVPTYTTHWGVPSDDKAKPSAQGPHFAQPTQATTRRADQTVRRDSSPVKPSPEASPTKSTRAKAPDFETEKRAAQRKRTSLPEGWMSPAQTPGSPAKSAEKIVETVLSVPADSPGSKASSQPASPRKRTSTYMSPTKATQQQSLVTIGTENVKHASPRVRPNALRIDTSGTTYGVDRPLASSPEWSISCGRKNARPNTIGEEYTHSVPPPSMRFPSPVAATPEPTEVTEIISQASSPDAYAAMPRASLPRPLASVPNTLQPRRMSRTDMLRPIVDQLVKHDLLKTSNNTAIARSSERSGILGPALDRLELSQGLADLSEANLAAVAQNIDQAIQQGSPDQQALGYLQLGIKRETRRRATLSKPRDVINEPIFNSPSGLRQLGSKAMSQSMLRQIKLGCPEKRQQKIVIRELGFDPDEAEPSKAGGMRNEFSAQVSADIQARIDQKNRERWARKNAKREEAERRTSERRTQSEVREPVGMPSPPEDPAIMYHGQKPASNVGITINEPPTPGSLVSSTGVQSAMSTLRATAAPFQPRSMLQLPWANPDTNPSAPEQSMSPSKESAGNDAFVFKHSQPATVAPMAEVPVQEPDEYDAGAEKCDKIRNLTERAIHERLTDEEWSQIPEAGHRYINRRRRNLIMYSAVGRSKAAQLQSEQQDNSPTSLPTLSPDSNDTNTTTPPSGERDITGGRCSWKIRGDTGFSPYSWTGSDGKEISFRGYGPAAERNPFNPVTYHRDAANAPPRQPVLGPSTSPYITPDAPRAMRLDYAKRHGLSMVPCNHVDVSYANMSMLPYPGTCGVCNHIQGLYTGNVAVNYPQFPQYA